MSQKDPVIEKASNLEKLSLRQKVAFYLEDTETNLGLYSDLVVLGLIMLSSAIFVIQTYPISLQLQNSLRIVDTVILIVFAIEYFLRFWSAENSWKFFF